MRNHSCIQYEYISYSDKTNGHCMYENVCLNSSTKKFTFYDEEGKENPKDFGFVVYRYQSNVLLPIESIMYL